MTVKIGVPSKGRLMEKCFDWFGARGLAMRRTGNEREYAGTVRGWTGCRWCCCRPARCRGNWRRGAFTWG